MSVEQWLGLALRIVGAVVFLYGVGYLVDGALFHLEYFIYADSTVNYYIVVGLLYCAAGVYLLRGAPHVVRFAYPPYLERNGQPRCRAVFSLKSLPDQA